MLKMTARCLSGLGRVSDIRVRDRPVQRDGQGAIDIEVSVDSEHRKLESSCVVIRSERIDNNCYQVKAIKNVASLYLLSNLSDAKRRFRLKAHKSFKNLDKAIVQTT